MFEILSYGSPCEAMMFPIKYGLPPVCVEGNTVDSPEHVKAFWKHLVKVQQERKEFEFKNNSASSLAQRWNKRMHG